MAKTAKMQASRGGDGNSINRKGNNHKNSKYRKRTTPSQKGDGAIEI